MHRRRFLEGSAFGLAGLIAAATGTRLRARGEPSGSIDADIAIIGGGLGGCAAALGALRNGARVVLTEPTDWIGGQVAQQAVPFDEHPWIEQFGCNASYRALRAAIRQYYRDHYSLTAQAAANPRLNPGNGNVSPLCHEPRVALAALTAMLAPFASAGRLTLLLEHLPINADVDGDHVKAVTVQDLRHGDLRALTAPYFIDATELGDLLPLAGVEYVTGFESQAETGELHAPAEAQPENHQSFTCCFAMEYRPGEDHTIDKPAEYASWRDYVPAMTPPWAGKLLDLVVTEPTTLKASPRGGFDPSGAGAGYWLYRRILDPANFQEGTFTNSTGVTLVNWPQNDYWLGNLFGPEKPKPAGPPADPALFRNVGTGRQGLFDEVGMKNLSRARQLSLSLLYWLQTEVPRPGGGNGWPGLKLRPDLVGTADGLAKHPYVRESRRIRAEFTVLEQHVGTEARRKALGKEDVEAERFADSVGVGSYRIDLHPSTGGNNYIDVSSLPFQIPLGALLPKRVENLLPACKNLGVTHITNGCYRLHPVEWAIGEAAGTLAAHCVANRALSPRGVRNTPERLHDFQRLLKSQGVEIDWPKLTPR